MNLLRESDCASRFLLPFRGSSLRFLDASSSLVPVVFHDVTAHAGTVGAVQDSVRAVLCSSAVEIPGPPGDFHILLDIPGFCTEILETLTGFILLAEVLLDAFSQPVSGSFFALCRQLHQVTLAVLAFAMISQRIAVKRTIIAVVIREAVPLAGTILAGAVLPSAFSHLGAVTGLMALPLRPGLTLLVDAEALTVRHRVAFSCVFAVLESFALRFTWPEPDVAAYYASPVVADTGGVRDIFAVLVFVPSTVVCERAIPIAFILLGGRTG